MKSEEIGRKSKKSEEKRRIADLQVGLAGSHPET
jgi:hypothetical protein